MMIRVYFSLPSSPPLPQIKGKQGFTGNLGVPQFLRSTKKEQSMYQNTRDSLLYPPQLSVVVYGVLRPLN